MARLSYLLAEEPEERKGKWRGFFHAPSDPGAPRRKLFAEIGCGKGKFLTDMAALHPERLYIGIEGNLSCLYHALEKAGGADEADEAGASGSTDRAEGPGASDSTAGAGKPGSFSGTAVADNVRFVPEYITLASDYFEDGELDGIYLNFSDPWPKPKHAKRRLTAPAKLEDYISIVRPGGAIEFRTDNDGLFDYTLRRVSTLAGIRIAAVSRDLHAEREEVAYRTDLLALERAAFSDDAVDAANDGFDQGKGTLADLAVSSEYEDKFSAAGKSINYLRLEVL